MPSLKSTKININSILSNPYRNFPAYPLDKKNINNLVKSIKSTGYWGNILVRPHPSQKNRYELAYGHHRIEALKRLDYKKIDVQIREIPDHEMILIMTDENRTQYGNTTAIFNHAIGSAREYLDDLLDQYGDFYSLSGPTDFLRPILHNDGNFQKSKHQGVGKAVIHAFINAPLRGAKIESVTLYQVQSALENLGLSKKQIKAEKLKIKDRQQQLASTTSKDKAVKLEIDIKTSLQKIESSNKFDLKAGEQFDKLSHAKAFREIILRYKIHKPQQNMLAKIVSTVLADKDHLTPKNIINLIEELVVRNDKRKSFHLATEQEVIDQARKIRLKRYEETEKITQNLQNANHSPPIPIGCFSTIIIDPPWPVKFYRLDCREHKKTFPYPRMALEDIQKLQLPIASDTHVFLWSTQSFLPAAIELFKGWNIQYKFTMVWHKSDGFQQPNNPRYNCEFIVYGKTGSPKFLTTKGFPACFNGKRREHSRKPEEFYDIIRRTCNGPRLDMFSREHRAGFISWGNEVEKFNEPTT